MSLLRPDARGLRLLDNGEPLDATERAFLDVLQDAPGASEDVRTAYELYQTPARHVLNALILTRADPKRIQEDLQLSEATYEAYRHLFLDTSVFKNVFAVRAYIRSIADDSTEEYQSYNLALIEGSEALLARYRLGDPQTFNEELVATRALSELSSRMTEHRGRSLTSSVAKTSLSYAQAVLNGTTALRNLRPPKSQAIETAFELSLVAQIHSKRADEAPVAPEELIRSAAKPK